MHGRALSPSPIAVFLLSLAERGADGSVEVGGRHILLRKGQVVDVRPAAGDGDLGAFLRDSGRIAPEPLERCAARARDEGLPLEEVLVRQRLLSSETLRDVRRGLFLDRLVRAMARADAEGQDVSLMQAEAHIPEGAPATNLVTLVLDALERRAAEDDAGQVGARADHRLEWLPSPHLERAIRWARFDGKEKRGPVAGLLQIEPAAAPRIAGLVRAGLARIVSPDAPPAPPPRAGLLPPAVPTRATPPLGSLAPEPSPPSVEIVPSLFPIFVDEPVLTSPLPELPQPVAPLGDPLDALERRIAMLEQAGASGPERAAAWRAFGDAWEERYGSLEEASRAYREAAAADPGDRVALSRASELCAALGQADLAVAYARAAVSQAPEGKERSRALFAYALLCRRLGKLSEALGALRAAAADASDPEPLALSVHLWRELGRPKDAAKAAAEAADRVRPDDPGRALALSALALGCDPGSPERAEAYAAELARSGHAEAAIAVRAHAARRTNDDDLRRSLLLAAAEQAELADRADVAAELLIRAFDAEPHVDVLYEPLAADLAQAPLERALLLEEIAAAAPEETRAGWLVRAADARLELPDDGVWEVELRTRALELDPDDDACWRAIREQAAAQGDPRVLADALERALRRGPWPSAEAERRALEELARLAEELDAPLRAAWAWTRLGALTPDDPAPARELARLAPAIEAHRADAPRAERLEDDPERRREALARYRERIERDPGCADALERLERLLGEPSTALERRAVSAPRRAERARAGVRLAALAALEGRFEDAARACRRVLEEVPSHREASLRLRRAASRLGDPELLREALAAESALALPPGERARVLTALALELEDADSIDEAISCAEAALTCDPGSAEAALLVTRHLDAVEQPRAALGVVRALFGDSPPILEAWARVARGSGERDAMLEALDAWARAAPYDPEPRAVRLAAFSAAETPSSLATAIEDALAPARLTPRVAAPLAPAIGRLAELGDVERAAELAVRAADALGPHGDPLRELAGQLAAASGRHELRRAALERRLGPQIDDARVELLHELAALHRDAGDRAAEARTHLRVLAVRPHEPRALERLQTLYAETGETDRLMAALALELEGAPEETRIVPLRKLAAASALRGDLDRAESFLREAWKPELDRDEPLFESAGMLVTLGRARAAVALLRASAPKVEPRRAAPIFLRAVQIALKKLDDSELALEVAVEGLEHAPSSGALLLAFERLALELDAVDLAERTFARLRDRAMGPHGRRALAYRRARWLERSGGASLDAYLEAFDHAPQAGAVYASIERLAREQGNLEALATAALRLAEHAAHPAIRASMAREAARILEHELGDTDRAFDVLARLWEEGDASAEEHLMRLGTSTLAIDRERGEAAFARLLDGLRKRAEDAWVGEARARLLVRLGRVHALGRGDLDAARSAIDEALAAAREDGDDALVAEIHLALAQWLLDFDDAHAAGDAVREALSACPSDEAALALASKLGIPATAHGPSQNETGQSLLLPLADEDRAEGVPTTSASSHPDLAPPPRAAEGERGANALVALGGAADLAPPEPPPSHVALAPGASSAGSAVSPTKVLVPPAMGRWLPAAPPEELEDAATLERRAAQTPERAVELLRAALVLEPHRISALRALAEHGDPHARTLLSLLEPALADDPLPSFSAPLADPSFAPLGAIWALLWEQALPLFRETPEAPPDPNARVTRVATTPEARAFAAALDALGREDLPAFYFDRAGEPALVLARTAPPSILAGPGFAEDEPSMRFALGRAVHLTLPEHILIATLSPERLRMIAAAVTAAFGPADEGEAVERDAAALASELWRTMPARAQTSARELLIEAGERWSDVDVAKRAVEAAGLRAGLVASGHLGVAVRAACASDPELAALDLATEDGLARALQAEPVRSLVRLAFAR